MNRETILPAVPQVAGSAGETGAGRSEAIAPRSPRTRPALPEIEQCHDVMALKRLVLDADRPVAVRNAAERRLRKLVRKPRL